MSHVETAEWAEDDPRTRQEALNNVSTKAGYTTGRTLLTKPICNSVIAYLTGSYYVDPRRERGAGSPTYEEYRTAISEEIEGLHYEPRDATGEDARPFRRGELLRIDRRMGMITDRRPWTP